MNDHAHLPSDPDVARQRIHVVLNPRAGAGRVARRGADILRAIRRYQAGPVTVHLSSAPGCGEALARHAVQQGADVVVAVGGDGTVHEVANGLAGASCALGVVDCGTGSGFTESLPLPRTLDGQARILAGRRSRRIDVGRITFRRRNGETSSRRFVSECQVGIGAAVCERLDATARRLGGRLGFGLTALRAGLAQRAVPTTVVLDDETAVRSTLLGVAVANGPRTGGGMRLAPGARLDDGRLDVVLIGDVPVTRRPAFLARLYRGRHLRSPFCRVFRAARIEIRTVDQTAVAADGEALGVTPVSIVVEPGALCVRAPDEGRAA